MPSSTVAIIIAIAVLVVVVVRELVRWRGGRWRRSGPRGDR